MDEYKKRLGSIVDGWRIKHGRGEGAPAGFDELAGIINQKMGGFLIDRQTLNNWHRGDFKRRLTTDRLEIIGVMEGYPLEEAADEARRLLEGKGRARVKRVKKKESISEEDLVRYVKSAPSHLIPPLLIAINENITRNLIVSSHSITAFIQDAFTNFVTDDRPLGHSVFTIADMEDFLRLVPSDPINKERIRAIAQGRLQVRAEDLPAIAVGLRSWTGRIDIDYGSLLQILSTPDNCRGNHLELK